MLRKKVGTRLIERLLNAPRACRDDAATNLMRFRSNIVLEPDPFPKSPFPKSPLPRSVAQTLPDYAPGFCWSIFGQSLHTHRIVAFSRSCSRNSWRLRDYKAACRDAAHIRHDTFVARLRPRAAAASIRRWPRPSMLDRLRARPAVKPMLVRAALRRGCRALHGSATSQ